MPFYPRYILYFLCLILLNATSSYASNGQSKSIFEDFSNMPLNLKYDVTNLEAFCDALPIFSIDNNILTFRKILETRYLSNLDNQTVINYLWKLTIEEEFTEYHPFLQYFIFRQKAEVFAEIGSLGAAYLDIQKATKYLNQEKNFENEKFDCQIVLSHYQFQHTGNARVSLDILEKAFANTPDPIKQFEENQARFEYWKALYLYKLQNYQKAQSHIEEAIAVSNSIKRIHSRYYPLLFRIHGERCDTKKLGESAQKALKSVNINTPFLPQIKSALLEAYLSTGELSAIQPLCSDVLTNLVPSNCEDRAYEIKKSFLAECIYLNPKENWCENYVLPFLKSKMECNLTFADLKALNELLSLLVNYHYNLGNTQSAITFQKLNLQLLENYSKQSRQNAQILRFYTAQNTERFKRAKIEKKRFQTWEHRLIFGFLFFSGLVGFIIWLVYEQRKRYGIQKKQLDGIIERYHSLKDDTYDLSKSIDMQQEELRSHFHFTAHTIRDSYQQFFIIKRINPAFAAIHEQAFNSLKKGYNSQNTLLNYLNWLSEETTDKKKIILETLFSNLKERLHEYQQNIQFTYNKSTITFESYPEQMEALLVFLLLEIARKTDHIVYFYATLQTKEADFLIEIHSRHEFKKSDLEPIKTEFQKYAKIFYVHLDFILLKDGVNHGILFNFL